MWCLDISCTEIKRWNVDGPQKARMILQWMRRIKGDMRGRPHPKKKVTRYISWELVFQKDNKYMIYTLCQHDIFADIWLIFMMDIGKYAIHIDCLIYMLQSIKRMNIYM